MAAELLLPAMKFHPATLARWSDIEVLFGERGACGGCWCMTWRLRSKEWTAGKGTKNKRAFKKVVTTGEEPGVIGYCGKQPIAWCAVAPRQVYSFLDRSRVLKPVDDQAVWSISCFFILKPYRRQGISGQLLKAAVAFAAQRGAKIVEGYPTEPYQGAMPDSFLWTGVPATFKKVGFTEVARRSRSRPIMRYIV
jgi:GNAT superfamily N-acetyltransferase